MTDAPSPPVNVGLLAALYLFEAAGLVLALALYKYLDHLTSLTPRQELILITPAAALVGSGGAIARRYLRAGRQGMRRLNFTVALNLAAAGVLLVAGEAAVTLFAVKTPGGVSFAGTLLLPRSWDDVKARNAALLEHAPPNISYFVSDTLLGWTIGPNRRSGGLYFSSAEGIRSARAGVVYANRPARHTVAIVGDSYTFGLEVPFEEAWGSGLENSLGPEFRVLNFGVDGYGVDQAYLRYTRDVRPWRPNVTIFGFIQHDLERSLSLYSFVTFPSWGFPFSKPRFKLHSGTLGLLNVPVISPAAIVAKQSVAELPFITYDPGFRAADWRWHFYDASRLVRFLLSRFPSYPAAAPGTGEDVQIRINAALLQTFARRAVRDGTMPLIVYFPSRGDFSGEDRSVKDSVLHALGRSGVNYLDLTPCLRAVDPALAFLPGRPHYSAVGNAAVARCLSPVVRRYFPRERTVP